MNSDLVERALVSSGLPAAAINLVAVPSTLGLLDDVLHAGGQLRLGTYFEVLARLFRFHNQTAGDEYLHSHPPCFYLRGDHDDDSLLAGSVLPGYRSRAHPDSVDEMPLAEAFTRHGNTMLARVTQAFREQTQRAAALVSTTSFAPLKIIGLECLEQRTKCLGDGPDAAYFAPNVHAERDEMELHQLKTDDVTMPRARRIANCWALQVLLHTAFVLSSVCSPNASDVLLGSSRGGRAQEVHVVTLVHHRLLNASVYGSVAMVKPGWPSAPTLSKSFMRVRATPLGVTSFDFPPVSAAAPFISWAFTRNPLHCGWLRGSHAAVDGCSVVEDEHVPRDGFLTYCERVYLNPATGLGPDWDNLQPARLYHVQMEGEEEDPG